jgi:hypothetical protein
MALKEPLPIREIIGSTIADLVKAESQSAQATFEFIENIGFKKTAKSDNLGELRMISFSYLTNDANGKAIPKNIEIPLLSLIPIPIFQLEEAEIELNLKIEDINIVKSDTIFKKDKHDWLELRRAELYGNITSLTQSVQEEKESTPKIKLKLKIKQSDLPNGMPSLLRILDNNIKEV